MNIYKNAFLVSFLPFKLTSLIIILLFSFSSQAFAEGKPDYVIDYRRNLMFNLQRNLTVISNILKGNIDHQNHLSGLASIMDISAMRLGDAFKENVKNNGKSKAKENIWTDNDDFTLEIQSLVRETSNLVKLAESNDIQAFRAQFGVVGKTCSSCHRKYKNR